MRPNNTHKKSMAKYYWGLKYDPLILTESFVIVTGDELVQLD